MAGDHRPPCSPLPDVPDADPGAAARLRQDLTAAGYDVAGVHDLLGEAAHAALDREQPLPALRATAGSDEPAAVLLRLFVLGQAVPRHGVERALPRLGVAGAARLGLVRPAGSQPADEARALVDLRPYATEDGQWWLASDRALVAGDGALRPDHVLGVGGASSTLTGVTIRRPVGGVLDLGTGCGVQALHALGHAHRVVATDLSPRCLAFTAFNAELNGLSGRGLELRRGDLLEPVRGDRFDQVVCNPPFVVTPRSTGAVVHTYRDGGRDGDDLIAGLVRDVGQVLAPGGTAQLLGSWLHRRGQDWRERVGGWLQESGLDGWVVQREVQDPAEYAETWLRDGGVPPGPALDAAYQAWLDDFERRDVEAVGFGLLTLRRPVGKVTLRRLEDQRGPVSQPLGPHLAACLAGHDLLARSGALEADGPLLALRLVVAPDVTEERHHRPGEADPAVLLLRQGGGFGRTVRAGTALAALVGACDGELSVGQVIGALAVLLAREEADLASELLPGVQSLIGDAMLLPAY